MGRALRKVMKGLPSEDPDKPYAYVWSTQFDCGAARVPCNERDSGPHEFTNYIGPPHRCRFEDLRFHVLLPDGRRAPVFNLQPHYRGQNRLDIGDGACLYLTIDYP